ncbi:MAG: DNA topoisomerase 3 [Candidatus Riflebacteria bacterium]|nr:DNA topoisomerase 3 [Candidatus Riflebacteria bacterium]
MPDSQVCVERALHVDVVVVCANLRTYRECAFRTPEDYKETWYTYSLPMKTLVFAEKPSVGRDIARILNAHQRHDGCLEGPNHVVTWGIGHLVALSEPAIQNHAWKNWSLDTLPMVPDKWLLTVLPQTAHQFGIVKRLLARDDICEVVNAADAGREGELIFRLIYREAGCSKPFRRLWISSMTDEAIRQGFSDLQAGNRYDPLAMAAEARSRSDWLVGMNGTRGYTKKFGGLLTVGRVQTPTLALVVKRHLEILDFKPVDYWEVRINLDDFSALWFDPKEKDNPTRFSDCKKAKTLIASLSGKNAQVDKVTMAKKKQPPPFLYDLTTLQREANSRYGFSAADTLKTAQSLYETRKVITYPRTDSRHLSDDLHATVGKRLSALPGAYEVWRKPLIASGRIPKTRRVFDNTKVSDHHAIIPTEQKVTDVRAWRPDEQKVYDMIVRRFLAAFMGDLEYEATNVVIKAENELFKANGRVVTKPGWRTLYDREPSRDDEDELEPPLPSLKKGDIRSIKEAELLTKQTKPPAPYTEASLLQAMETAGRLVDDEEKRLAMKDSGLGTPATRAEIMEKLIRVGYLVREKKKLMPTPKGIQLIRIVDGRLASPELTGDWERRLARIARGEEKAPEFMRDITEFVKNVVEAIKRGRFEGVRHEDLQKSELRTDKTAKISATRDEKSAGSGKPDVKKIKKSESRNDKGTGIEQTDDKVPTTSKKNARSVILEPIGVTAQGRPSFGVCPACGKGGIIEGQRGFGCDRYREGCHYVVWKEFCGKILTKSALQTLILGCQTKKNTGFTTPDGRIVNGRIRMKSDRSGIELVEEVVEKAT